jgi:hypothetical protein
MSYQDEIEKRIQYGGNDFFRKPVEGIQQYPLIISSSTGRADFCWEFGATGRLFVEDEDDQSQRALNNLVKYWAWCDQNPDFGPVYLIHILGHENTLNVKNARFIGHKMELLLNSMPFQYHSITHSGSANWHNIDADWLQILQNIVVEIRTNALHK